MKRKPIKRGENILSPALLSRVVLSGLYISTICLLQHKFDFLGAGESASTVIFALFALFALFNAFNCRELFTTTIFKNFFKNRLMLIITFTTMLVQVLIIQFAGAVFGTVPLPLEMWGRIFAVAISVIVLSEIVKLIIRCFIRR
jgi:Ca2+-transporting ATPase